MNAQLIYKTADPRAVAWMVAEAARQQEVAVVWRTLIRDVTSAYGLAGGQPRELSVNLGLVGGFRAAPMELAPPGWTLSDTWGGFVPDPSTHTGRDWQRRIDDMPQAEQADFTVIGMPPIIAVIPQDGSPATQITTALHLPEDQRFLYALWPDRNIKPVLDALLSQNTNTSWTEVPRSVWYAIVEADEASHG